MSERDGKDQREDSRKRACSYGFARHGWSVTSGTNLYRPGVWFEDAMSSFSCVTFVMVLSRFGLLLLSKPRLSNISRYTCTPTAARSYQTTVCVLFYCERSELVIYKVHRFGLGCIKNCAR